MPPSTTKIDDLRGRFKAEPKGRHFLPLAEELRKNGQLGEAEQTLLEGLKHHQNYLSAWVSLGRVYKDSGRLQDAVDALQKALALDGNNAVTARLLADTYLAMGEKIEAIKKYKLVNALVPDADLQEQIEALDRELNPPAAAVVASPAAAADELPSNEAEESGVPLSSQPADDSAAPLEGLSREPDVPLQQDDAAVFDDTAVAAGAALAEPRLGTLEEPFGAPELQSGDADASTGADAPVFGTLDEPFGDTPDEPSQEAFTHHDDDLFSDAASVEEEHEPAPVPAAVGVVEATGGPASGDTRSDDPFSDTAAVGEPIHHAGSFAPAQSETRGGGSDALVARDLLIARLEGWLARVKR